MSGRGHAMAHPAPGYQPPQRLFLDDMACVVRVYQEEDGNSLDFNFATLPVARDLQIAFARAFTRRTGPAGSLRAWKSVRFLYYALRRFAQTCAAATPPPSRPGDLTIAHLDRFALQRGGGVRRGRGDLQSVRATLMVMEGLSTDLRATLVRMRFGKRIAGPPEPSYSAAEWLRVMRAARADLRAAAERIRKNTELLERWRAGGISREDDPTLHTYASLLDVVARMGDVPRYERSQRRLTHRIVYQHGGGEQIMTALCLTWREMAAACVLLICHTGVNGGTLVAAPVAHHRADNQLDGVAVAIVHLVKARRGRRERYLSIPLTDLPAWTGRREGGEVAVDEHDQLATPFGVYTLLLELTAVARGVTGSLRLFLWWDGNSSQCGMAGNHGWNVPRRELPHFREGLRAGAVVRWGQERALRADSAGPDGIAPLRVTMNRLRRTFAQMYQQPVAHTPQTLADEYLVRDRGAEAILTYQQVVAGALAEQVDCARAAVLPPVLRPDDIAEAATQPDAVAARYGVTVDVLRRVLDGRLDTVLTACVDYQNGPYTPAGKSCDASFLMCLECPCARATPRHLPLLLLALDALEERGRLMTRLAWARRFGRPHTQLADLLARFPSAIVAAARADITNEHQLLIGRLLEHELDVL